MYWLARPSTIKPLHHPPKLLTSPTVLLVLPPRLRPPPPALHRVVLPEEGWGGRLTGIPRPRRRRGWLSPSQPPPAEFSSKPHPHGGAGVLRSQRPLPPSGPAAGSQIRRNSLTSGPCRAPGRAPPPIAAAAGPAHECECECECGRGAMRSAPGGLGAWRVCGAAGVSASRRRVRADPAARLAPLPRRGPRPGGGWSAACVRGRGRGLSAALATRARARALRRPRRSETPPAPSPGSMPPRTHARSQTHARRAGAAPGSAAASRGPADD